MLSKNSKTEKNKGARNLTTTLSAAFFALSMMVLIVVIGGSIIGNSVNNQANLSAKQQGIAQNAAQTVSNSIEEKFTGLETAVEFANPVLADSVTRKTIMGSLLGLHPAFRQFALLDKKGGQLAQISRALQSLSPQFALQLKSDLLLQTIEGKRYISSVYIDELTSEPQVTIAIPVKDILGDYQGTLAAEVNLKFLWDLIDQVKVGETGYAYVVDNQGNLIAFTDTTRVLANENVKQIPEVKEFLDNSNVTSDTPREVAAYTGLLGKTVVGTYVPLGTPKWAVVTEMPTSEAYQPIIAQSIAAGILTLVTAILTGLAGVFVARRLSAPLIELSNLATDIGAGNLELQAKVAGPVEIAHMAEMFNSMTRQLRDVISNLEKRVAQRTAEFQTANEINARRAKQFEAISQVSRAINQTRDLQHLLPQITQVISQQFNFYHVGIFLSDANNEYAVLAASNSEGGQRMLARDHKLKVGEMGIVGNVAGTGIPRIALDTGADAIYFNNPDLPETHSEMALPLLVSGQQPIGVIDVQSREQGAFGQDDIQVLSTLAEQVSIAIANARLYEETQKALLESETFYRRNIKTGWAKFIRSQKLAGIRTQGMKSNLLLEPLELPGAAEVTRSGNIYQHKADDNGKSTQMTIPVKLHGEMVGMLGIKTDEERKLTGDEMDVITAIVERAALSIESARLLAESRTAAEKERAIGEISAKISAGTEIQAILKTAVRELGNKIGGAQISVEIGSGDE